MVERWNDNKPHRCPKCHVVVDTGKPMSNWSLYQCCHCLALFARHPWLAVFRRKVEVCQDIATGECPYNP